MEPTLPRCHANGIEIEYDTFGSPTDPAMLLIMGLSMQLTGWEPGLCKLLAERGFHVIRFDNRDMGLSTYFDEAPVPDIGAVIGGDYSQVTYLLADLADDAAGLLTALGIEAAHVVGVSMGGMIVQELLLRHPDRVLTACSIMSTTGAPTSASPRPRRSPRCSPRPRRTARRRSPRARPRGASSSPRRIRTPRSTCASRRRRSTTAPSTRRAPRASSPRSSPPPTARRGSRPSARPPSSSTARPTR
jgi:pimeloyl-ACP methyl ester carboxylesterase